MSTAYTTFLPQVRYSHLKVYVPYPFTCVLDECPLVIMALARPTVFIYASTGSSTLKLLRKKNKNKFYILRTCSCALKFLSIAVEHFTRQSANPTVNVGVCAQSVVY